MTDNIDVLLIDDHRMFSDALELLLKGEDSLNMIGAAENAEDALEMCKERCPGVVLMDIDLPGMDGIQATRRVKQICPEAQVVIITALQQPDLISRAIESGACGYVPKTHAADELVSVIKRAAEGDMILPSGEIRAILERLQQARRKRSEADQLLGLLSKREVQILQALSEAKSTSERRHARDQSEQAFSPHTPHRSQRPARFVSNLHRRGEPPQQLPSYSPLRARALALLFHRTTPSQRQRPCSSARSPCRATSRASWRSWASVRSSRP